MVALGCVNTVDVVGYYNRLYNLCTYTYTAFELKVSRRPQTLLNTFLSYLEPSTAAAMHCFKGSTQCNREDNN